MTIYRVPINLEWPAAGSPGVNVWSVRTTSDVQSDAVNLQEAVNALHTFYDTLKYNFANGMKISLGEVVERETQNRAAPTFAQIVRDGVTGAAPQALQVCISWRTSLAARRGMGRTFLGPLNNGILQDDGTMQDASLTLIRDTAQSLVDDSQSTTNGWAIGVYGLVSPAPVGTSDYSALPHVHRDIIGLKVRDKFAVLRSRRD